MRTILYSISGETPRLIGSVVDPGNPGMVARKSGFLGQMANPASLPPWLSEDDVDFYTAEFAKPGFGGGLDWYRNIDRNCELSAPLCRSKGDRPGAYIAGERDVVPGFPGIRDRISELAKFVPQLRGKIILPGCGHWIQQERPAEVNAAMIEFLRGL